MGDGHLPANPTFSDILVKLAGKITVSATAQKKDQVINDLITNVRKNRQLLEEHNFVLTELKNGKPLAIKDELGIKEEQGMKKEVWEENGMGLGLGLIEKVEKIIAVDSIKNVLTLRPTDNTGNKAAINIFGFKDIPSGSNNIPGTIEPWHDTSITLTFDEVTQLRRSLEDALTSTCSAIIKKYNTSKASFQNMSVLTSRSCLDDSKVSLYGELSAEVNEMNVLLSTEYTIYQNMLDRREFSCEVVTNLLSCLKLQVEAAAAKAKAVDLKINKAIYLENEYMLEAFHKLHSRLEEELLSSNTMLQKLQMDEKLYQELAGNDSYQMILKEYKDIQKFIRQKKLILQRFY